MRDIRRIGFNRMNDIFIVPSWRRGMREILFRGKRVNNGEWVEGFYTNELYSGKHYISRWIYGSYAELQQYEVIPETVGQYTGFTDIDGKKIFESDILAPCVKIAGKRTTHYLIVTDIRKCEDLALYANEYLIYCNAHDNPDFVKVVTEYDR